jgi:prepilin-type processing-associated H-X9-DG protein
MRADYDSEANALSIDLIDAPSWEGSEAVGRRVNVSFADGRAVNVELLYPNLGLEKPLEDAAARYELDAEALIAAAKAAVAAPDRVVTLDVAVRA